MSRVPPPHPHTHFPPHMLRVALDPLHMPLHMLYVSLKASPEEYCFSTCPNGLYVVYFVKCTYLLSVSVFG